MKYETFYGEHEVYFYIDEDADELSLSLIEMDDGWPEPYCDVTVHVPGAPACRPDEAFVKDWSENDGLGRWLEENEIATRTGIRVRNGFVTIDQYKFDLDKVLENSWQPEPTKVKKGSWLELKRAEGEYENRKKQL